jgi:hypothetical protein
VLITERSCLRPTEETERKGDFEIELRDAEDENNDRVSSSFGA